MKRFAFTVVVTVIFLLLFAVQNRFIFGISSVRPGMTMNEVHSLLGNPEFFETETDNWYFLKFYPLFFGAIDVKIDMRDFMSAVLIVSTGETRTGDQVTSIMWKPAFCLDTKKNLLRLSH
jgi:hypothetical protein